MRQRAFNISHGWHVAYSAVAAGFVGVVVALAAVQGALRVIIAHGGSAFDQMVAHVLLQDLSGNVLGLAAGSGVPVDFRLEPFQAHITASWILQQRSELVWIGTAPLLGAAAVGWYVAVAAKRLALPRRRTLVAAASVYALVVGTAQVATGSPLGAVTGVTVSASTVYTVLSAAAWVLVLGGLVVRFYPTGTRRSDRQVRSARRRSLKATAVTVSAVLITSLASAGSASSSASPAATIPGFSGPLPAFKPVGVAAAVKALGRAPGHAPIESDDQVTGTPSILGGVNSPVGAHGVADWLHAHAAVFGVADTNGMLSPITGRVQVHDPTGAQHTWYDQSINGVPVYDARLGVHLDKTGSTVTGITNGLRPDLIAPASTTPSVSRKDAVAVAATTMPPGAQPSAAPALVVFAGASTKGVKTPAFLAWQVDMSDSGGTTQRVFVDALHNGYIVSVAPLTEEAINRTIYNADHASPDNDAGRIVRTEGSAPTGDSDVDKAYTESGSVYGYYLSTFGRDSLNNMGMELHSLVHVGFGWQQAEWTGAFMKYGDRMVTQDITGHEMTHGVTQFTSGLEYQFQSGALNESLSDFFGEETEQFATGSADWLLGEGSALGVIRSMIRPGEYGQPITMSGYEQTCLDNGGVHKNSGIPNNVFYRMRAVLGDELAEQIVYRAQTTYLKPTSTFADVRQATIQAATDLSASGGAPAFVASDWSAAGVEANTPDPRPAGCSGGTVSCSTLAAVSEGATALSADGAPLDSIAGALIHAYEIGTVTQDRAIQYYESLFLTNRPAVDSEITLDASLANQLAQLAQAWQPVLSSLGPEGESTYVLTQAQIDAANSAADAFAAAATQQGKPQLAQLIATERARFDSQHLVGLSVDDAEAYLDTVIPQSTAQPSAAASLAATFNNVSVTQDTNTGAGSVDGLGASYSAKALANAGVKPGSTITHDGLTFTWPTASGTGAPDNTIAQGQTIALSGSGDTLGFLVSETLGPSSAVGTLYYSDGTTTQINLNSSNFSNPVNWNNALADVAVSSGYENTTGNKTVAQPGDVYYVGISLQPGKTPVAVQLPPASTTPTPLAARLHVYALSIGNAVTDLPTSFNNVAVTQDTATAPGDVDGWGSSYSAQALAAAGAKPGAAVTAGGLTFTWPGTAGVTDTAGTSQIGTYDNIVSDGQTVPINAPAGNTLGFLLAAANGAAGGTATIHYSDGSTQAFTLTGQDWFGSAAGTIAIKSAYQNRQGNVTLQQPGFVYYVAVPLQAGKTAISVQLPTVGAAPAKNTPTLHIFAITRG